jgi:proline iminopeptidase
MNRFGLLRPLTIAFLALALAGCSQQVAQTPAPPPIEDGFVAMEDGTRLFYRKVGNGPQAVVLPADLYLHPTFDRLAPGRTLYYYDMRNRGLSDSVTADRANSIQQDVLDLEELRAHLGLESVDLVGYSYLGLMVVMYAKAHPAHVRRIVQLGPVPVRFGTEYPD